MKPYGLMADLHCHNWQAFSSVGSTGINSRLAGLIAEISRCAAEVIKVGGDAIYIAGDVFHVRGSIAPSVLNPVLDTMRAVIALGVKVVIIPGNHDLEGKHTTRLGSAVASLESVGCYVAHRTEHTHTMLCIPWFEKLEDLEEELRSIAPEFREATDVIMHAPIDGVMGGLGGLDPAVLASLGYRRIFAGHYHNHKDFGNGVYSIGALAHHSWSDVGSKAGFLIVSDEGVRWMKSHLPEFYDITGEVDPDDLPLIVEGNFVRAKIESSKMEDVESLRAELKEMGAMGVVIQSVKKPVAERDGVVAASVKSGASLEVSVAEFVRGKSFPDADEVISECMGILAEAGV